MEIKRLSLWEYLVTLNEDIWKQENPKRHSSGCWFVESRVLKIPQELVRSFQCPLLASQTEIQLLSTSFDSLLDRQGYNKTSRLNWMILSTSVCLFLCLLCLFVLSFVCLLSLFICFFNNYMASFFFIIYYYYMWISFCFILRTIEVMFNNARWSYWLRSIRTSSTRSFSFILSLSS